MNTAIPLAHRGIVRVTGEDRLGFLQGLLTCDLMAAGPESALYGALLTPQGKILHDLFVAVQGDAVLLDAEAERLPDLLQRLGRYRLRAKVAFEDAGAAFAVLALPGGDPAIGLPAQAGACRPYGGGVAIMVDPRHAGLGLRLIVPRSETAPCGNLEDYQRLRLELGVGDGAQDFGEGMMLALEANFDRLNGVSFTKGCYVGQEVTARSHHRSLIRRRLRPLRLDGPPPPGTPVLQDGQEVGELRSGCDGLALALLRTELADTPLTAAGVILTPLRPVWNP